MSLALGPVTRFMTRSLYTVLDSRSYWGQLLTVSPLARGELQFWFREIRQFNCQPVWHSPSAVGVVFSDASDSGYGGYTVECGPQVACGQWSLEESSGSSTMRELSAVTRVLAAFLPLLRGQNVRWFTDNQNVEQILRVGSRKPQLQSEALKKISLAVQNQIKIDPEWIPRELNEQADYVSRIVDYDDWQLNRLVFHNLDVMWGPHTIDRFASYYNAQTNRFDSRYWNPGCSAVDTFTCSWADENNWWCPPPYLIPRLLKHAAVCAASGTLIIPLWPSAFYWPIICPDGLHFASFVHDWCELPLESLFIPGRRGSCLFKGLPNTRVLALRLDFRPPPRRFKAGFCTHTEGVCSGCATRLTYP